jgi:hypothetical protein
MVQVMLLVTLNYYYYYYYYYYSQKLFCNCVFNSGISEIKNEILRTLSVAQNICTLQ